MRHLIMSLPVQPDLTGELAIANGRLQGKCRQYLCYSQQEQQCPNDCPGILPQHIFVLHTAPLVPLSLRHLSCGASYAGDLDHVSTVYTGRTWCRKPLPPLPRLGTIMP